MNKEVLQKAGIDYEAGLKRFMGDEELYLAVLTAFSDDDVVKRARCAYDGGDKHALLSAVHEAKGASGNAGMDGVYRITTALVSLLRSDNYTQDQLDASYREFETAYCSAQTAARKSLET